MSKDQRQTKSQGAGKVRTNWLDESTDAPMIHEYAHRLAGFIEAMADGKIETQELRDQEVRLVAAMKKVEPALSDAQHEDVTHLLCELTAYNIMHTLHELASSRPKTKFRG
jgi:hypothetical protein